MPIFAHLFGVREWEMDLLTHDAFLRYREFADAWVKNNTTNT